MIDWCKLVGYKILLFFSIWWTLQLIKVPWHIECGNLGLLGEKPPPWSYSPIFNPVILNSELFHCLATLSKWKSIGFDNFLNGKSVANMYFYWFTALEVVWQRRPSTMARHLAWPRESHVQQSTKVPKFSSYNEEMSDYVLTQSSLGILLFKFVYIHTHGAVAGRDYM